MIIVAVCCLFLLGTWGVFNYLLHAPFRVTASVLSCLFILFVSWILFENKPSRQFERHFGFRLPSEVSELVLTADDFGMQLEFTAPADVVHRIARSRSLTVKLRDQSQWVYVAGVPHEQEVLNYCPETQAASYRWDDPFY